MNEAVDAVKSVASEVAAEAVETKTAELKETFEATMTKMAEEAKADRELMQKSIDEVAATNKGIFGIGAPKLNEKQEKLKGIAEEIKTKGLSKTELSMKDFTAGTSTQTLNPSAYNQHSTIYHQPNFKQQIRDVVNTRTSDGGSIVWNRETAEDDNAGPKGRGIAQEQTDKTVTRQEATFKTLANFYTMPEEWLDDIAAFESYISNRLMMDLIDSESRQLLRGTSAANIETDAGNAFNGINMFGNNLIGAALTNTVTNLGDWAGTFSTGAGAAGNATRYDAIVAMASLLQQADYSPTCVILNPFDYNRIALAKSDQGYEFQYGVDPATGMFKTWLSSGIEVVVSNAQTANTATVFDKSSFEYVMREGVAVEFDRNGTDFSSNNISIRAMLRGEVADFLPQGVNTAVLTGANSVVGALNNA